MLVVNGIQTHPAILDMSIAQTQDFISDLQRAVEEAKDHATAWPVTLLAPGVDRQVLTVIVGPK